MGCASYVALPARKQTRYTTVAGERTEHGQPKQVGRRAGLWGSVVSERQQSTLEQLAAMPADNDTVYWTENEVRTLRGAIRRMESVLEAARADLCIAERRLAAGVS